MKISLGLVLVLAVLTGCGGRRTDLQVIERNHQAIANAHTYCDTILAGYKMPEAHTENGKFICFYAHLSGQLSVK